MVGLLLEKPEVITLFGTHSAFSGRGQNGAGCGLGDIDSLAVGIDVLQR